MKYESSELIINADGSDMNVLREEGIQDADAFVAVTDSSEANIFACLAAKRFGVRKTIAEIVRAGEGILVNGETNIIAGDLVVLFCKNHVIRKLERFFT